MKIMTANGPASKGHASALLALAIAAVGCARDRDFAVVEPGLSRQYQANALLAAAPPAPTVVGVQQVAGQRNAAVPVYQTQVPTAAPAPATAAVAPPPSSTGLAAGQPYYTAAPAAPGPVVGTTPPPLTTPFAPPPGAVPVQTPAAGVYPAAPTGMWTPTRGNQAIALHQFTTPTTGSSFVPSAPMDGATASTMRPSDGILPASATVPFTSAAPTGPPPQNARSVFLSESAEAHQPSRIPPTTNPPPAPIERPDNALSATPLPAPPNAGAVRQLQPAPTRDPIDEPTTPSQRKSTPPPNASSEDDLSTPKAPAARRGETIDAPPSSPPRTGASKSPSLSDVPKNIEMPGMDAKKDAGKKPSDRSDSTPKKTEPLPSTKKSDAKSIRPDEILPDDDSPLAPPKARGSGS